MRRALVLVLSVWTALPALGRAQQTDESLVRKSPVPAVVNGHTTPGGCPSCGHAAAEGTASAGCGHEVRWGCMRRILQWATYRPLPYTGCGSCSSCRACGSCRLFHGCGRCCKQCAPCCEPPLYAFFLHRCPCRAHVHHYPTVYKTWEGKWPPAYAGPDDKDVIYTDEEPLMP